MVYDPSVIYSGTQTATSVTGAPDNIEFRDFASAGSTTINYEGDQIVFYDNSTAAVSNIYNKALYEGSTIDYGPLSPFSTQITNVSRGVVEFTQNSNAGSSNIINLQSGSIIFSGFASASQSKIDNDPDFGSKIYSYIEFGFHGGYMEQGDRTVTTTFSQNSDAGYANITNRVGSYTTQNSGFVIVDAVYGTTNFSNNSSAGHSIIDNIGGKTNFDDGSNAQNASIVNTTDQDHSYGVTYVSESYYKARGSVSFTGTSSAGFASIKNSDGDTYFTSLSTAAYANLTNQNGSTFISSNADHARILNDENGSAVFQGSGTANHALVINQTTSSQITFSGTSTAGSATLVNEGGQIIFSDHSTAGLAVLTNDAGTIDFSKTLGLASDHKISVGSLAGAGTFELGSNQLTIGADNSFSSVSGLINDGGLAGGVGGSLVKAGTGTLVLAGSNTFSGGIILKGGTLDVSGPTMLDASGHIVSAAAGLGGITFTAGAQTLVVEKSALDTDLHFNTVINGFAQDGDLIDIRGIGQAATSSFDYAADLLTLRAAGGQVLAYLQLQGDYTGSGFKVSTDGAGGTLVESVALSAGAGKTILGTAGSDALYGTSANDIIDGLAGADTMSGGAGNDSYYVDHRSDVVLEAVGGGVDTVFTKIGFTLGAGQEVENLIANGPGNWQLTGNEFDNQIIGNSDLNFLDGGAGADVMIGLGGNDYYTVDNLGDRVIEVANGGFDTVRTALDAYALTDNVEVLTYTGTGSFRGTGNTLSNQITGGVGNDTLDGGGGVDKLIGGKGDDTYIADNAADIIIENAGEGRDTILTYASSFKAAVNVEVLTYVGTGNFTGFASDTGTEINGGSGNDALRGAKGIDILNGHGGSDVLAGGAGADTFYVGGPGAGITRILDFTSGEDHLALDRSLFKVSSLDQVSFVTGTSAMGPPGQATLIYDPAGKLYWDGNGGAATDKVLIATFDTHPVLTNGDFLIA